MKRFLSFAVLSCGMLYFSNGFCQKAADKVALGAIKARNTASTVSGTATEVKNTTKELKETFGTLFPKKEKKNKQAEAAAAAEPAQAASQAAPAVAAAPVSTDSKTLVTITNIDFSKLKSFEENIKACANVKSTVKKFNTTSSTIEVTHTGTTDELLELMLQTCKDMFNEKKVESYEQGKMNIKL